MSVADLRLKPIADAIADGRCDVLSVDIFDTLIWRRVPEPKDIFAHVAAALANDVLIRAGVSAACRFRCRPGRNDGANQGFRRRCVYFCHHCMAKSTFDCVAGSLRRGVSG
jgi:hypothetical protein